MDGSVLSVPQTEEELNQLIENSQGKKLSTGGYIILSLVFPPFTTILAIFLAARKNILHLVMPSTCIVYSILMLLVGASNLMNINSHSQFAQVETIAQPVPLSPTAKLLTFLCLIIGAAGIFAGFYFRSRAKREYSLENSVLVSLGGLIMLEFFLVTWLIGIIVGTYFNSVAPVIQGSYQGI